jgi:hypothetical protein
MPSPDAREHCLEQSLRFETHPEVLGAAVNYLCQRAAPATEVELGQRILRDRLAASQDPLPTRAALLTGLLTIAGKQGKRREETRWLMQRVSTLDAELCMYLGHAMVFPGLTDGDHDREGNHKPDVPPEVDPQFSCALLDLATRVGPHHVHYPHLLAHALHLRTLATPEKNGVPIDMQMRVEQYLLTPAMHFRGPLLDVLAPRWHQTDARLGTGARSLQAVLHLTAVHGKNPVEQAAAAQVLAEADAFTPKPFFPTIVRELLHSGPPTWRPLRLTMETWLAQSVGISSETLEHIGSVMWKTMHQNGETERYAPLMLVLARRLTPEQLGRMLNTYPAVEPLPAAVVSELHRQMALHPTVLPQMVKALVKARWETLPPGRGKYPPPDPAWQVQQWRRSLQNGIPPHPMELDRFLEDSQKASEAALEFFCRHLHPEQEPLAPQRALNWQMAGAIIRRYHPEMGINLLRQAAEVMVRENDPLPLHHLLSETRGIRLSQAVREPEMMARWGVSQTEQLIGQWYRQSPDAPGPALLRWVILHELHQMQQETGWYGKATAQRWGNFFKTFLEEATHSPNWMEREQARRYLTACLPIPTGVPEVNQEMASGVSRPKELMEQLAGGREKTPQTPDKTQEKTNVPPGGWNFFRGFSR